MLLKAIYLQVFLICFSLLWLWVSKRRGFVDTAFKMIAVVFLFTGLWVGGVWIYPPYSSLFIISIFVALVALRHIRKPNLYEKSNPGVLSNLPVLLLLPLGALLSWQGLTGRASPTVQSINLTSPFLPETKACVISGGSTPLLNLHIFPSDQPRDLAQIYALDIVRLNWLGFRTTPEFSLNPLPKPPHAYAMFDTPVVAPCAGRVVAQENALPDYPVGEWDDINTGGNGVVLACGLYHVHLHHMKQASVRVELGDKVVAGQALVRIGNSGKTREPHLHLHAETIVEAGNPDNHGDPVHMRFEDRFLARGDCF